MKTRMAGIVVGMLVGALMMAGCGGGDGDGGNDSEPTVQDNSRFFGNYRYSLTASLQGDTAADNGVVVIGGDVSRRDDDDYLYIPSTGESETYSGTDSSGAYTTTVNVSGQTLSWHEESRDDDGEYTTDVTLQFADDGNSAAVSGRQVRTHGGQVITIAGTFTRR